MTERGIKMKDYIKLMIRKYWKKLLIAAVIISAVSFSYMKSEVKTAENFFHYAKAVHQLKDEGYTLWEEMNLEEADEPESTDDTEKMKKARIYSDKIENLRKEFELRNDETNLEDLDNIRRDMEEMRKMTDEKIPYYYYSWAANIILEPGADKENEFRYGKKISEEGTKINPLKRNIPISASSILSYVTAFSFIAAALSTCIESMTRYKYFDESLPISKRKKFLSKVTGNIIMTFVYTVIVFASGVIIYRTSSFGNVIDYTKMPVLLIYVLMMSASVSALFTLIGSFCGNIISYIPSAFMGFLGLLGIIFPFVQAEVFFRGIDFAFIAEDKQLILGNLYEKAGEMDFLSHAGMVGAEYSFIQMLIFTLVSLAIIIGLGMFIADRLENERRGMFYMNKTISKIYYIAAIIFSNTIVLLIFFSFVILTNSLIITVIKIIFYLVITAVFALIYRYLFRIRLSA